MYLGLRPRFFLTNHECDPPLPRSFTTRLPRCRQVMTARRDGELPKLLRRLGRDASEELGAYASGRRNKWLDAWARGSGALPPLRP